MKKVITYGTFDLFHLGHYNILKRAKELGDYLIVGVTSESYDLERGKLNVKDSLLTRIQNVKATGLADEIIVEEYQGQKINDVIKYQVDILVVGSDWIGKFDYLKKYCEVKYLERTKNISSTQLREEKRIYKIGIVTNKNTDDDIVLESKYVSGMHIEGVYHPDICHAQKYCDTYELNFCTDKYEELLKRVDIVCIKLEGCSEEEYVYYVEKAIDEKKHLICNMVHIKNAEKAKLLLEKASEQGVLICEDLTMAYVRAFEQMLWYIKGGIIGDIVSLNINISSLNYESGRKDLDEIIYLLIFAMLRIIGTDIRKINKFVKDDNKYESIYVITSSGELRASIGLGMELNDSMEIIGSKGRLYIPEDWWQMRYFKVHVKDSKKVSRYSYNFDGTGFKYILMDMISMLESGRRESCKIFPEESMRALEILHEIESLDSVHQNI